MAITTKTAISVPKELLERCDSFADSQGVSRSALLVQALEEFLNRRDAQQIAEKLKEVYSGDSGSGDVVRQMRRLQLNLVKGQW